MPGNPFRSMRIVARACALAAGLALLTGCGFKIAGPGERISIAPIAGEDLSGPCTYDLNMPDQPNWKPSDAQDPTKPPPPTQVAALVIYERGDSSTLYDDSKVQSMAASLHLVTIFAHQCDSAVDGDLQPDATQGPGRTLFAAMTQYAADSKHPEIAKLKVILFGFSAAGVLTVSMESAYPDRVMTGIPYASGDFWVDLDDIKVTPAMAQIPTLVLANAYDSDSGDQRSLRLYQRAVAQGAVWGFGVQNNTDHCCTLSVRDVLIPWVTALTPTIQEPTAANQVASPVTYKSFAVPAAPNVSFSIYTDGWPDAQGENDFWIPNAALSPTAGGPFQAWMPNSATAQAWLNWVTSPGTN